MSAAVAASPLVPAATVAPTTAAAPTVAPRVYNAIYSSVQVYECMVRGIAVMRRRLDSYVNATQILKVAGVDKGRRTKILEKEILPGRHEIVQGGYGKYQGTWIPLERGREVATQFGVLPILAPLFDYVPPTNPIGAMTTIRTPHAVFAYPASGIPPYALNAQALPIQYPPPPGTALNVLQQGRSTGLFTPTATFGPVPPGYQFQGMGYQIPQPVSQQPSPSPSQGPSKGLSQESSQGTIAAIPNPDSRPSPAASSSTARSSKKRSRANDESTPKQKSAKPVKIAPALGSVSSPKPVDDVPNKRQRLEDIQEVDLMDIGLEATQPDTEITLVPSLSQADTLMDDVPPYLPPVVPNGIHPLPLPLSTTKLSELPDTHSRFSTKPPAKARAQGVDRSSPLKDPHCRAVLLSVVSDEAPEEVLQHLRNATPPDAPLNVDLILDDQGHTPLHWAASLARLKLVEVLLSKGADVHRGNFSGETPLIRTVLSIQPHETHSFDEVLTLLLPSLRTVDNQSQTVLHHIAHVAGVKGRAAAARYYMETVLERVVRHRDESGGTAELVDLQDLNGDTALNISARVGNRALVRMLIDIGANRVLGNKLGLRPGDFGVEGENLKVPFAEDYISALKKGPSPPVQKSQDVIAELTQMISNLSSEFSSEVKTKQDSLDSVQAQLRAATRELAEQRRQMTHWQSSLVQLNQVRQRRRNLERVLQDEDHFDWTGRSEIDGSPATESAGKMFEPRAGKASLPIDVPEGLDPDPPFPASHPLALDPVANLVRLKRMQTWHARTGDLMQRRIEGIKGASAEKEFQCRRIVSLCTGVSADQVDGMLENLVIAMESDGQVIDLGRVAGFMQKVQGFCCLRLSKLKNFPKVINTT